MTRPLLRFEDGRVSHPVHIGRYLARIVRHLIAPAHESVALVGGGRQGYGRTLVVSAHARYTTHGLVVHRSPDEDLFLFTRTATSGAVVRFVVIKSLGRYFIRGINSLLDHG